jgi:hypothetical protein
MESRSKKQKAGSSMLDLAPEVVRKKVNKRRQKKDHEHYQELQQQRAVQAQNGEFAPPLTP